MPGLRPGATSFGADAYARQRPMQVRRQQLLPQPPQPQKQDKQGKQQQRSPPPRPPPRPARGDAAHDAVDSGSDRHDDDDLMPTELVDAGERLPAQGERIGRGQHLLAGSSQMLDAPVPVLPW